MDVDGEENTDLADLRDGGRRGTFRGALSTAVDNPRGESVSPLMYISLGKSLSC